MYPTPLHPVIVHFPIVLMILQPIVLIGAFMAVRRGASLKMAWGVAAAFAVLLAISAFAATQTGEDTEREVKNTIGQELIEEHAEGAELFRNLAIVGAVIVLIAFALGGAGRAARMVSPVFAIGLIWFGYQAGHSGGALVYEHGAASAYSTPDPSKLGSGGEGGESGDGGG
ncbi:MAG: DUF2231 domain-containing protein [Ardenticatenales bacterium]